MVSGTIIHYKDLTTKLAAASVPLTRLAGLEPQARKDDTAPRTIRIALTCGGMLCSFPCDIRSYKLVEGFGDRELARAAAVWDLTLQAHLEMGEPLKHLPLPYKP